MLKEVDASGQISLGKRFAGQLFEVTFHDDGRVEILPMQAVPARRAGAGAGAGAGGDVEAPDAWLPPGGYDACNAWALENRPALEAYAQRIEQDGTAAEQLQAFLAAPPVVTDAQAVPRFDVYRNPNARAAAAMLRNHVGRLGSDEQLLVETSTDFMLRGY